MKSNLLFGSPFNPLIDDFFNFSEKNGFSSLHDHGDGTYSLTLDVPGLKKEDLTIEVQNHVLSVRGETKRSASTRSVFKTLKLAPGFDENQIAAHLENGVLELTFKLNTKETLPKKIEIQI